MPGSRTIPFVIGEYYHVYNRGIDKRIIYKSVHDYKRFIMLLYVANSNDSFRLDNLINNQHKTYREILSLDRGKQLVSIGAWVLMENHFHLLLREDFSGGITKFMKKLGTAYSMSFNIKYQRTGALFGGRFKSRYIDKDEYLKHLFGYIHLNPLDIKFSGWEKFVDKKSPKEWKEFLENYYYSSFQDYINSDRLERGILNKTAFFDYFSEHQSFSDLIDKYLSFDLNDLKINNENKVVV